MPTLLVLDNSLSMLQPVKSNPSEHSSTDLNGSKPVDQVFHLAKHGLDLLLEHLQNNYKMEHVALLAFASQCELVYPFSRDIADIRQHLSALDCFDKTNIIAGVRGIASAVEEAWNNSVPVNVVLVTDGGLGNSYQSLSHFYENTNHPDYFSFLPFRFRGNFSVVCLNVGDTSKMARLALEKLMDKSGLQGLFLSPSESELTRASVEKLFRRVIEEQYKEFSGTLKFGDELSCAVTLCPPPVSPFKSVKDFDFFEAHISSDLDIKGFFTLADLASPPVISRHLILPETKSTMSDEETRQPNLCVFLHGAMKVEGLAALVQVGNGLVWDPLFMRGH